MDRLALEARWLELTRTTLPALAAARRWPVRADHCFQRILLDHVCGGCWYDHLGGRPAYRCLDDEQLRRAVAAAEAIVAGDADVDLLNRRSLAYRSARRAR
ncbi:GCN5-related N-acetyltransferase [Sphingomonas sp.]|uniref:GCN5-related N-acetyltransferase n=1 Tax=Sphingomonas sp. TaxID=28214 RepID=UPI003CC5A28C